MDRYFGKQDDKGAFVADSHRDGEECFLTRTATIAAADREAAAMNRLYDGIVAAKIALREGN